MNLSYCDIRYFWNRKSWYCSWITVNEWCF